MGLYLEKENSVLFLYFFTFLKQVLHVVFFFLLSSLFSLIMCTLTITIFLKAVVIVYILILYFSFCQFSKRTYKKYLIFLEMTAISATYNLYNLYIHCSHAKIGVKHQSINQSIIYLALFIFAA